ncbi:MAG: hypothetical protein ACI934_001710, partial [Pseudohongiellaceae bacterium]
GAPYLLILFCPEFSLAGLILLTEKRRESCSFKGYLSTPRP